jgi:E3 UFM1-protein ligase 1
LPKKIKMEEILKLQAQLAAVQNTSTLNKLADRNVIEILNLLT